MAGKRGKSALIFKVDGIGETTDGLKASVGKMNREAIGVISRYSDIVLKQAKANAPQSPAGIPKGTANKKPAPPSGTLKKSITKTTYHGGLGAMIFPEGKLVRYRHYAEYGTKERFHKTAPTFYMSRSSGKWAKNAGKSVGSYAGRFFMENAKKSVESQYNSAIKKAYGKEYKV